MKHATIVFVSDNGYIMQTTVAITSAIQNMHRESSYDIYVIGTQLSRSSIQALTSLSRESARVHIIQADPDAGLLRCSEAESAYRVATKAALLKFEIPALLQESKAIYLDGDVIVRRDLTDLFSVDLGTHYAAVVRDVPQVLFDTPLIDTGAGIDYFNSGVMVMNLELMRQENVRERLIAVKQSMRSDPLMDQNVFNLVFAGRVLHLPVIYNVLYANLTRSWKKHGVREKLNALYHTQYLMPEDILYQAVVIHYSSKDKPWKYFDAPLAKEWMQYYRCSCYGTQRLKRTCLGWKNLIRRVRKLAALLSSFLLRAKGTLLRRLFYLLSYISPRWNTQLHFLLHSGKPANLKNPKTFSEKISWLKLNRYAYDRLVRQCADKLEVRSYVEQAGLGHLLNELFGVYAHVEDIPWSTLPQAFVLKWNFGSGYNCICPNKSETDPKAVSRRMAKWNKRGYWPLYAELQYKNVPPRILCERYLDTPAGEELLDYKLYCFHGEVKAVLVIARPDQGEKSAIFMSPEWEILSDIPSRYSSALSPERPMCLEQMLDAARILSSPFPFVRVDFYQWRGKAVFGEMTFTPAAGIFPSECLLDGSPMGEFLHLDENERV